MSQLIETGALKTRMCHRLELKLNSKIKVPCKQPQYASLLRKVLIFSVTLFYLTKYFRKNEIFLEHIFASMKV